jgi:hypothetical protein
MYRSSHACRLNIAPLILALTLLGSNAWAGGILIYEAGQMILRFINRAGSPLLADFCPSRRADIGHKQSFRVCLRI